MSGQTNKIVSTMLLVTLATILTAGTFVRPGNLPGKRPIAVQPPDGMAYISGGEYVSLYTSKADTNPIPVAPFLIDKLPVTNAEYLRFVRAHPEWRKSGVKRLFADETYLDQWPGDLDFGVDSLGNRPVVNVSWFAAMAYAEWAGKRLPTIAEWEIVASAGIDRPDGNADPERASQILNWYSRPSPTLLPAVGSTPPNYWGVSDQHGLIWEWVLDFNTAFVTGESRNNGDIDLNLFCGSGTVGASNFTDYASFIRFAYRSGLKASYTVRNLGFRCARDVTHS